MLLVLGQICSHWTLQNAQSHICVAGDLTLSCLCPILKQARGIPPSCPSVGFCVQYLVWFKHVFILPHVKSSSQASFPPSLQWFHSTKRDLSDHGNACCCHLEGCWLQSGDRVCVVLSRTHWITSILALAVSLETVTLPCTGEMFSLEWNMRNYEHGSFEPNYLVLETRLKY